MLPRSPQYLAFITTVTDAPHFSLLSDIHAIVATDELNGKFTANSFDVTTNSADLCTLEVAVFDLRDLPLPNTDTSRDLGLR